MAEEQGKKEESTEKVVALQTMYIKDISFEAPNSPDVFLETDISPETKINLSNTCLLYTSPSPRDRTRSRMPSSA